MSEQNSDTPCPACSWTTSKQKCCDYTSYVKLFYGARDRGVWSLGSDYILKERPNRVPRLEVDNIRFIKQHTTIPVLQVVKDWVDDSNRYFVLMERAKSQTLDKAWATLSPVPEQTYRGPGRGVHRPTTGTPVARHGERS
ncbi:hypothetical protein BBP40_010799 [Aspergillus hancockii]|nr:hypothetical protein BBP40_010799 [Aspergillus hancockii]